MYYFNLLPYFFFRPLCWSSSVCYNVYLHFPEFKIPLSLKSSINEWCHKIQRKYVTLRYLICYIRYSENFDKWNWSFSSGIYPDKHKVKVRVFFYLNISITGSVVPIFHGKLSDTACRIHVPFACSWLQKCNSMPYSLMLRLQWL